jgi:hypothetical protein
MLRAALAVPRCSPAAKQAELDQRVVVLLGSVAGTLCGEQEWQQCMTGQLGPQGSMLQRHMLNTPGGGVAGHAAICCGWCLCNQGTLIPTCVEMDPPVSTHLDI